MNEINKFSFTFFCMKQVSPQQRRFFSCSPEKKSRKNREKIYAQDCILQEERSLSKGCDGEMAWKTAVSFSISLSVLWWTTNWCHRHYLNCFKNFREKFIYLDNILQFPLALFEKTTAQFRDLNQCLKQKNSGHKVTLIRLGFSNDNALNFVSIQYPFFLSAKKD